MNQENFNYLAANLKYHGFLKNEEAGEKSLLELEQKIKEGLSHFQLHFNTSLYNKSFETVLNFRKADNMDMYFFNSYTAKLDKGITENAQQTFYINKGKGITAREAYNLLDGRSVFKEMTSKEGASYHAWLQLDPTTKDKNGNHIVNQYHSRYGFELGKSLLALPIKELRNDEGRVKLIRSLERGNLQSVTFERKGKEDRMFIEANPKFKTINLYDADMKRVKKGIAYKEEKTAPDSQEKGLEKTGVKTKEKKISTSPSLKTGDKENTPLLPKKRETKRKGLTP